jgi:hypothetical protein
MKSLNKFSFSLILICILFCFVFCTKEPGTGGTSSITGKLYLKIYNHTYTTVLNEYYLANERVFIVYGDDEVYSNDFRTHHDGSFRFDNLKKGTYHIYAYSKDSTFTEPSGQIPVFQTVEITKNNQHIKIDDIVVIK